MPEVTASFESHRVTPEEIQRRKIEVLVKENKELLGDFDIVPVGEAGFLLQSKHLIPMAGNDWMFFDYDDTLAATTEVKTERLNLYAQYLRETLKIDISDADVQRVVKMTDNFSRWEEKPGEGKIYHANAHMTALTWAGEFLQESGMVNGSDGENQVDGMKSRLDRITTQLNIEEAESTPADPFHFNFETKKLINHSKTPWSKSVEDIFMATMINPPLYDNTLEAMKDVGAPISSVNRTNVGVFTYGDPYYQLYKTFELLKQNQDLPISQIWLTAIPKGEFIEELAKSKVAQNLDMQYVPPELEDYPGESISYGSGYVLSEASHVVVMMDDNPKELNSILSSNDYLSKNSGATFICVRSTRGATKEEKRQWDVVTPHGEIDFRSKTFSSIEVSAMLKINLYLKQKAHLGDADKRTQITRRELLERYGIDTEQL